MIDIEKAKNRFMDFTSKFDLSDTHINRKIWHSLRVMEASEEIAKKLKLSDEEIKLATLIGLLHDIGRFEQETKYKTFNDFDSFDHGDFGEIYLKDHIREYIEEDTYDEIIFKAVKNHNKFAIEDGLSQKQMLFAKIARDADKIDIAYEAVEIFFKGEEEIINNSLVIDEVYEDVRANKTIKKDKSKKTKDVNRVLLIIAFVYDLNFKSSFEIWKERDFVNKIINRFEFKNSDTKEKVEEVRKHVNGYIEKKVEE